MRRLWYRALLRRAYEERFEVYGQTPEGSFWINNDRQVTRFEVIFRQVEKLLKGEYSVADIGCGYGAMVDYLLLNQKLDPKLYYGYDICGKLVRFCNSRFSNLGLEFRVGEHPEESVDISVMSGTYNLAATNNVHHWEAYVAGRLKKVWEKTQTAMVFNLQASSVDKSFISRNRIYYASPTDVHSRLTDLFGPIKIIREERLPCDITVVVNR